MEFWTEIDHTRAWIFCMKRFLCINNYLHDNDAKSDIIWRKFNTGLVGICASEKYAQIV
jgi:hypothetical protein